MSLNGITPVGDDQRWKEEVARLIRELQDRIRVLEQNARNR